MDPRNSVSAPTGIGKGPAPTADTHHQLGGWLGEMHRQELLLDAIEHEEEAQSAVGSTHANEAGDDHTTECLWEAQAMEEAACVDRMKFNYNLPDGSIDIASAAAINAALPAIDAVIENSPEITVALPINATAEFCPGEAVDASQTQQCG